MQAAHVNPEEEAHACQEKPVVVEAVQLLWSTWSEMCEFAGVGKLTDGKPEGCYIGPDGKPLKQLDDPEAKANVWSDTIGLLIPTLDGLMVAQQGDWIIKGVKAELYPCKPYI